MSPLIALAIATAAVVLLLAISLIWGRPAIALSLEARARKLPEFQEAVVDNRNDHWMEASQRAHDQRRTPRRAHGTTPILVTIPAEPPETPTKGLVMDRSSQGLCFASERGYQVGDTILVATIQKSSKPVWVSAKVRNCRERQGLFLIGCQFDSTVPWHVLLLFG